jgi:hypothetical protein
MVYFKALRLPGKLHASEMSQLLVSYRLPLAESYQSVRIKKSLKAMKVTYPVMKVLALYPHTLHVSFKLV